MFLFGILKTVFLIFKVLFGETETFEKALLHNTGMWRKSVEKSSNVYCKVYIAT